MSASSLGFSRARTWACPKPCPPPCPILPVLPEQGGVMPVLWQPGVQTTSASLDPAIPAGYTLNLITSQWIDKGILLRFQMWSGDSLTYAEALAASDLIEWDLVVNQAIPPGTVLTAAMTETHTALWAYSGRTTYASGGAGIPAAFFGNFKSLMVFAFAPTVTGAWTPSKGQPMFAIGFNHPPEGQAGTGGDPAVPCSTNPVGAEVTAPNFPDQFSNYADPWKIVYRVVYPNVQPLTITVADVSVSVCAPVLGIKFEAPIPAYPSGSWSNVREIVAQPWVVIKDNYVSVNNWQYYSVIETYALPVVSPDVGPFVLTAMPGQLVVVYWQPRYKDINTDMSPIDNNDLVPPPPQRDSGAAQIGLLVTSPLQPQQTIHFTNDEYDAGNGGFGPRNPNVGTAQFINNQPSFTWVTGSSVIPAGTVVFIDNIGGDTGPITIENAHDSSADVGAIINNNIQGEAVTSLIALSVWLSWGTGAARPLLAGLFVTAALSDQYAGDFPPMSPCLTINKDRWVGSVIYGQNQVFDNRQLPGTVQCALINCATFTELPFGTAVTPTSLPTFLNMECFAW